MNKGRTLFENYLEILKEELVPALGCTEPIAIAYAAAKAREVLGSFPEKAILECSGNIVKNVKSVVIPNIGGLTGIRAAMLAGLVGGKAAERLEVLAHMTPAGMAEVKQLEKNQFGDIRLLNTDINLHLILHLSSGSDTVTVELKNTHTHICRIEKNGQLLQQEVAETRINEGVTTDRSLLTVRDIYRFASKVPLEWVRGIITRQVACNMALAEAGLCGAYGVRIGRTLLDSGQGDQVLCKIKAYAAAASEARMGGCMLPVITNSGSGNQSIASTVPVIVYASEQQLPEERLYRGLVLSNLLTIHQKTSIGRLSAFCGAVSAACSSGAAITYLAGGNLRQINQTIHNMLANVPGIVCDGAKPSCAAKIASCLDAAYMAHTLARRGSQYQAGQGIIKHDVEETIAAVGRLASRGMRATDAEILQIMLE